MVMLFFYGHLREVLAHIICVRHEAAVRTRHVTGTNNLVTRETWEEAVEVYSEAFFARRLRITGKVVTGCRLAIENIWFD